MNKAIIMFADGSKQMAHNLDDSRLRWELRRLNSVEDVLNFSHMGIAIPDFGIPKDYHEAVHNRAQIQAMIASVNLSQSFLKGIRYKKQWYHLSSVNQELGRQMMIIKDFIKRQNMELNGQSRDIPNIEFQKKLKDENKELRDQNHSQQVEIDTLKSTVIQLQAVLLEKFGIVVEGIDDRTNQTAGELGVHQ